MFTIDPTGNFEGASEPKIIGALGYLFPWCAEWVYAKGTGVYTDTPLWDHLQDRYGFGSMHVLNGGTLTDEGGYKFPGDPIMWPIAKLEFDGTVAYFYQHGMVCVDGKMTRMD
jgi:hypothetical protein